MTREKLLATAGIIGLIASLPAPALAQDAEPNPDNEQASAKSPNTIIVTATKREQTLQDVPVAVSVVQAETLDEAQINDVFDLQTVVPSLQVAQRNISAGTSFTIRGFGNGQNNPGIEPSVGVYVDGVFRSRTAAVIADFSEIERIEVLRGPQSTLFGRNSSAGVVSIVTKKPQFTFQGSVEGTYGNYDQIIGRAYLTGPLSPNIAASIEGGFNRRDGYAVNLETGTDLNNRNRWNVRGQLLVEPSDTASFRLIADWDELDENCCFGGYLVEGPATAIVRALGGENLLDRVYDYETAYNFDPTNEAGNRGVSLQADFDLGFADLTSISAFRWSDYLSNSDGDFTTLDTIDTLVLNIDTKTFTQELRLSGESDNFDWLIGGFYVNDRLNSQGELGYGQDQRSFADLLSGGAVSQLEATLRSVGVIAPTADFFSADERAISVFAQDQSAFSIFGQADFHLTDRFTLTLGANYSWDAKDVSFTEDYNFEFSGLDLVAIGNGFITQSGIQQGYNAITGMAPTQANIAAFAVSNPTQFAQIQAQAQAFANANDTNPSVNTLLALAPLQFIGPTLDFPNAVESGKSRDENFSYTARLAYDVNDRLNVYASYSTGFKPTSFNLSRNSRPFQSDIAALANAGLLPSTTAVSLGTFAGTRSSEPEESRLIEIGLKSGFDWGSVNLTLFDQEITNFQTNAFQGTAFVFLNAGKQKSQGIEFEMLAQPAPWLDLNLAATYNDARFEEYVGAPGVGGAPTDLSGTRVPQVPEFASTTAVTLRKSFGQAEAFLRMNWIYESAVRLETNVPAEFEREVSSVNASLGLNLYSGLEFLVYARNLFNDEYATGAFPGVGQPGTYGVYPNAPRTYGLTVRKRF